MPDPFQILGLPEQFDLDEADIRRAYLARVAAIHPDLFFGDESQGESAELNRARESLSNPETRANLLLALRGGPSREADKSLPPAFLMEIMETREAIETALDSGNPSEREKWIKWGTEQRAQYIDRVRGQFAALGSTPGADALKTIRITLNEWRYFERLLEQLGSAPPKER